MPLPGLEKLYLQKRCLVQSCPGLTEGPKPVKTPHDSHSSSCCRIVLSSTVCGVLFRLHMLATCHKGNVFGHACVLCTLASFSKPTGVRRTAQHSTMHILLLASFSIAFVPCR